MEEQTKEERPRTAALVLAEKFNVNHRRSNSLHHVSDEVVFVSRAVGVVLSCNTHTHTHTKVIIVNKN